ncbi:MAG: hypothetical protein KatS3mg061_3248 [Dehalococcoidia bacterium]|nr:MAG: hypothetical protein KatS3mg061_3248 [Dehalococcoidia bacterium]
MVVSCGGCSHDTPLGGGAVQPVGHLIAARQSRTIACANTCAGYAARRVRERGGQRADCGKEARLPRRYVMVRRAQLTRETRRRIIGAVLDLVLERGPEDFSVEEICERAKVSLRTVYYHFPSRATLLSAALVELAREMGAAALRAWRDDQADPCEALLGYVAGDLPSLRGRSTPFRSDPECAPEPGARGDGRPVAGRCARPHDGPPRSGPAAAPPAAHRCDRAGLPCRRSTPSWRSYRVDLGWSTAEAIAFVTRFLRETLFQPNAPADCGLNGAQGCARWPIPPAAHQRDPWWQRRKHDG